jgi:hypothetical protein
LREEERRQKREEGNGRARSPNAPREEGSKGNNSKHEIDSAERLELSLPTGLVAGRNKFKFELKSLLLRDCFSSLRTVISREKNTFRC